mgnify:CR=1 FL=1
MTAIETTKTSPVPVKRHADPFGAMRDEVNRMFERFENGWGRWPDVFSRGVGRDVLVPEIDVHDNGKQLTIETDLPGVEEKDVSITVANGMLTIKGERRSDREEKKENYYLAERSYGTFERSLRLPDTIDDSKIEARFDKGVLRVVAQKKPEAVKAERRIEIKKAA